MRSDRTWAGRAGAAPTYGNRGRSPAGRNLAAKPSASDPRVGGLSLLALLFLTASVVSGLFVISGAAVMLGRKDYDLESPYVKYPGLINVFPFAGGFLFLALLIAIHCSHGLTSKPHHTFVRSATGSRAYRLRLG